MAKKPTPPETTTVEGPFVVISAVLHNGTPYEAGDMIEGLTGAEAADLLAAGAIATVAVGADPAN